MRWLLSLLLALSLGSQGVDVLGQCGPQGCPPPATYLDPPQPGWQAPPAQFQRPPQQAAPQSNVPSYAARIHIAPPSGQRDSAGGSGALIYKDESCGVILTAKHVVEGKERSPSIRVFLPCGVYEGKILSQDAQYDLAMIQTTAAPRGEPVPLATDDPRRGETLTAGGYGYDRTWRAYSGTYDGQRSMSHGARSGDSGGPVVNSRGELVGILWGSSERPQQGRPLLGSPTAYTILSDRSAIQFHLTNGRYLAPWNSRDNAKVELARLEAENERLRIMASAVQQGQVPPIPEVRPGGETPMVAVDLTARAEAQRANQRLDGVSEKLGGIDDINRRIAVLTDVEKKIGGLDAIEGRIAALDQEADQSYRSLQAMLSRLDQVAVEAEAAAKKAEETAVAAAPESLVPKIIDGILAKYGMTGLLGGGIAAFVLVWFIRKDVKDRLTTGDPLVIERLARMVSKVTPWQFDDRFMDKVAERRMGKFQEPEPAAE